MWTTGRRVPLGAGAGVLRGRVRRLGVVQHSTVVEALSALAGGYTNSPAGSARGSGSRAGGVPAPCLRAMGAAAQQQARRAGVGQQHAVTHGVRSGRGGLACRRGCCVSGPSDLLRSRRSMVMLLATAGGAIYPALRPSSYLSSSWSPREHLQHLPNIPSPIRRNS